MTKDTCSEMAFSADEWLRYTRHIQLPELGAEGQLRLKKGHVVMVGAGGLGSPVSLYLAAAGVGTITIVDHDTVDITNLQRQIVFQQDDLQKNKAKSAALHLSNLNPDISIKPLAIPLNKSNCADIVRKADIVVDCTDNFTSRYIINDTCTKLDIPWISASIRQFSGQMSLFTKNTGCFRCLYPAEPSTTEDCNTNGVLGVLPGIMGILQANEAIKYLCGLTTPLEGKVMLVNALTLEFRTMQFSKDKNCPTCNDTVTEMSTGITPPINDENLGCENAVEEEQISADEFDLFKHSDANMIIDVRSQSEHRCFNLGGVSMPLPEIDKLFVREVQQKQIICYCQSGKRSDTAVRILKEKGIHAVSLAGGIVNYLKQRR